MYQLIFDKGGKNIKWEKESLFSKHCKNLDSCMQSNETGTHPHTMHKNKLKMAERPQYQTGDHQTPGKNIGKTLSDINLMNIFSTHSPKATEIRAKIN